ncbi:MAG: AI-2E family transporter [Muribaculaceae bacterium]
MEAKRPYTFDRVIRIIFSAIIIIGILALINYLKGVLLPFLVACLLAYIIQPLVGFNKRILHLKGNAIPVLIALFEIIAVSSILGYFFIPYIISEIEQMIIMFQRYTQSQLNIPYLPDAVHDFIAKYIDFEQLSNLLSREEWMKLIENVASETWIIMDSSIRVMLTVCSWLVVFLYLVFILIDYDRITTGFKNIIPKKFQEGLFKVASDIQSSMNHYFRGQALISFIVGILFSIGFLIIGLPLAVVFGLFIGILNMVPYLQLISIPIAAILCLVNVVDSGENFWIIFGETFAVYCIVQLIQDMILTPKIMGKYMGLNPAIIFLSLSIWGTLLGFIGLIIALPLTTLIISYYDEYIIHNGDIKQTPKPKAPLKAPPEEEK